MKNSKLTDVQKRALEKMSEGIWYNSYRLGVSRTTLNALFDKGLLERCANEIVWDASVDVRYRLKLKEKVEK